MSKNRDLPPPVTARSSKKELWEELCASRDEIDSQQVMPLVETENGNDRLQEHV